MTEIISPLFVMVGRKKFYLNLNVYRNSNYHVLNTAKKNYKAQIVPQLVTLGRLNKISIHYKLFPGTKRRTDISNVCSVIDKFFCDALVEYGILSDDDYENVPKISFEMGTVDRDYPRVEITIDCLTHG